MPRRLSENSKIVVFNDRIVTGGGTASFAPTLTMRIYKVFETIRGIWCQVNYFLFYYCRGTYSRAFK
jgi:hypothetical protein